MLFNASKDRILRVNIFEHVYATVNGKLVFDTTLSPQMYNYSNRFVFKYKYMGRGDTLDVVAIKNNGEVLKKSKKIKRSLGTNKELSKQLLPTKSSNYHTLKPSVWKEQNITKAIELLYGRSIKKIDKSFDIKIGEGDDGADHPDWTYVSLKITSQIKLKSFAIFVNEKPSIHRAIFTLPQDTLLDYRFKIKMDKCKDVIVVGEGVDGKLYRTDNAYGKINSPKFKKMCYEGDIDTCFSIANGYRTGKGYKGRVSEINPTMSHKFNLLATKLFEKSCKDNDWVTCTRIIHNSTFPDSNNLTINQEKIKEYAKKVCKGKFRFTLECKRITKFLD